MSTVRTLIEPTADVIRIVSLRAGDVYKRLVEPSYGSATPTMQLGVVTAVMNNGTSVAVTAIEYGVQFSGVKTTLEVFTDNRDANLFPADPAEVTSWLADVRETAARKVEDTRKTLHEATDVLNAVDTVIDRVKSQSLTAPETAHITP